MRVVALTPNDVCLFAKCARPMSIHSLLRKDAEDHVRSSLRSEAGFDTFAVSSDAWAV